MKTGLITHSTNKKMCFSRKCNCLNKKQTIYHLEDIILTYFIIKYLNDDISSTISHLFLKISENSSSNCVKPDSICQHAQKMH